MKKKLMFGVFALIIVMTVYTCVTLFDVAVVNAEHYRAKANAQQLRGFTIPANRGTIFDTNGKILAQSKTVWTIVVSPNVIRENSETYQTQRTNAASREYNRGREAGLPVLMPIDGTKYNEAHEISLALSDIFDLDYYELMARITESDSGYEIVYRQAEKPEVDRLNEFKSERGIGYYSVIALEDTMRIYPNGTLAAALIGFTNFDNIGVYGIEAYYDDFLQGTDGRFEMARDANNQPMPFDFEKRFEAQNGHSLYLTIDEVIQHYLEKNLELAVSQHSPDNRATGIIMNAKTGAILAMATYPTFNLNEPARLSEYDLNRLAEMREEKINDTLILNGFETGTEADLTPEQIERIDSDMRELHLILRETQWKNKSVSELYFPGSVFKVITLAAALEEHLVSLGTGFFCGGVVEIAGEKIHCWRTSGHGQVEDVTKAMTYSCNPAFIDMGRRLGTQKFSDYFDAFGFTRRTGIDLPGETGSLFMSRDSMTTLDLSVSSIGQVNKITPLQMITAYAATVNGGYLVTPYVVAQIIDNDGNIVRSTQPQVRRQVISEETSALMRQILEEVVVYNGGSNAHIAGYRIGGKSGTSQRIDHEDFHIKETYVGSFGAFTPSNDPEIIMLVMVDGVAPPGQFYGSAVAAPVVQAVFKETLPYLEIFQTQLSEEELELQNVMIPYLINATRSEAAERLIDAGLTYRFIGENSGNTVLYTVPPNGAQIARNGRVIVFLADEDYTTGIVPNVIGLTLAQANERITNAGLNIRMSGGALNNSMAVASSQSIEAGEVVPAGTVIEVEFWFVDGHTG
ncbi:MAG: PASTA domain-containing protein [Oscillospiraceae bacterium]|jgi:stage V sporulation protein D (sporulation-specific penicillin-binding protein)|nr:PASTA domain-containing protein [Oscillospiraceae bacterium]